MLTRTWPLVLSAAALAALVAEPAAHAQSSRAQAPKSVRLYILDCGIITGVGAAAFGFKDGQLATSEMVTPCYLIAHPRGTLMWDTGEIPDSAVKTDGSPTKQGAFTVTRPLVPQLAALGYTPADITYLALSHYHGDHVANANAFASSTWIVQQVERDAMFAPRPDNQKKGSNNPNPVFYGALEKSKTIVLKGEDHDVFGDGTVTIKFTPGHTPGHQSLFVRLPRRGGVVLSGDATHFQDNWVNRRVPANNFDKEQSLKSMDKLAAFITANNAQLWINHDKAQSSGIPKAPAFVE
jgi:N-acyl homoserine lactone hydrolase